jgi:spore maturation protein CgeB
MDFRFFYHSLVSDWNHGNAHFLRGVVAELLARGHAVRVFEPHDGWSRSNLRQESSSAFDEFHRAFPQLQSELYELATLDVERALDGADVVIVHEWTDPAVLARVAEHRTRQGNYGLLFHDTHHRAVSDRNALAAMHLERFDGVLAFGASLAQQYQRLGWGKRVWVWHEAADMRLVRSRDATDEDGSAPRGDLVWVGNWGDDERVNELNEYLIEPVRRLRVRARVHGVRYPPDALARLQQAGIEYAGWIPNYRVPEVFARHKVTVHVPRRPYVAMLPGIPTIRVFEALACGIPLVSAPWDDCEGLFRPGDFIMVQSGDEMTAALARVLNDREYADDLSARGLETIHARHTCAHRVDELLDIVASISRATTFQEV